MPVAGGPTPSWRPGLDEVAAFVPTRTRPVADDGYGSDDPGTATFTASTTPTGEQVEEILDGVEAQIVAKVGATLDARLWPLATRVAALGAAADVERGFPTGADTPNVAAQLQAEFTAAFDALVTGARQLASGQALGAVPALLPDYQFPPGVPTVGFPAVTGMSTGF